jgi:16S rRNA (guanine527-N7)-methyltransferase
MFNDIIDKLLADDGVRLSEDQLGQLAAFCDHIRAANEAVSLVSAGDAARLESVHVPDSLSLAAHVARLGKANGRLLDIGSGGGFPAIPIKIAFPELEVTLIERSVKKSGFLREAVAQLGLAGVTVITGEFPHAARDLNPTVITARAVERSEKVRKDILRYLKKGCVFLCQMPQTLGPFPPTFHVEHILDNWSKEGIRRGTLDIVRRR